MFTRSYVNWMWILSLYYVETVFGFISLKNCLTKSRTQTITTSHFQQTLFRVLDRTADLLVP
jgi:hypothetical protein